MSYWVSHIDHDTTLLEYSVLPSGCNILSIFQSVLGKVANIFFTGEEHITELATCLKSSTKSYKSALGNINLCIVFKVYKLLKGTLPLLQLHVTNVNSCYRTKRSRGQGLSIDRRYTSRFLSMKPSI